MIILGGTKRGLQISCRPGLALLCIGLIGAVNLTGPSWAQQAASAPPPVSIKGWQRESSPPGLYAFFCGPPQCASKARLVYQLLPPNPRLTFEQYRLGAGGVTEAMKRNYPPGSRLELVGVDNGSKQVGDLSLRLFKTRRLLTMASGERRFFIDGRVSGSHHTAAITSTAGDEKTADANLMQFAAPLWLLANDKRERAPDTARTSPPAEAPPVAVGPDWRYQKEANDLYMFHCQNARCVPPSRVSYRLYAPDNALTLPRFRQQQETVVKALQERAPPGTQIKILETTGDEGTGPRRMFVSQRLISHPDGRQEFISSTVLLGTKYSASLISSSPDQKAVKANQAVFALAVMLFINADPKAQQ